MLQCSQTGPLTSVPRWDPSRKWSNLIESFFSSDLDVLPMVLPPVMAVPVTAAPMVAVPMMLPPVMAVQGIGFPLTASPARFHGVCPPGREKVASPSKRETFRV